MPFEVRHVVASLDYATGGPAYSVPALSNALRGLDCSSLVVSGIRSESSAEHGVGIELYQGGQSIVSRFLQGVPDLRQRLRKERSMIDIVHTHGIWTLPNWYAYLDRNILSRAKFVQAPRGMLSQEALKISRLKKSVVWHAIQKHALRSAHAFHVTAESELEDIRRLGFRQPAILVPNGISVPDITEQSKEGLKTLLFIGRVHPKKGLETLLNAWQEIQARLPDWQLKIIGPAEIGYDDTLERLAHRLSLERFSMRPPIYGDDKWAEIAAADVMILPSYTENFGNVVTESLACRTPVIATKGTPWAKLESQKCGWWIERTEQAIVAAVTEAAALSQKQLAEMGERGRVWMQHSFGWDFIAQDMLDGYRWLISGGTSPKAVIVD